MGVISNVKNAYRMVKDSLKLINDKSVFFPGRLFTGFSLMTGRSTKQTPLIDKLDYVLSIGKSAGIIYLDIVQFHEVQQVYGTMTAARILSLVEESLRQNITKFLPQSDVLAVENLWADDFVVLFTITEASSLDILFNLAVALRVSLRDGLRQEFLHRIGRELELHVGYDVVEPKDDLRAELKFYMALREAQKMAKGTLDLYTVKLNQEFKKLLEDKSLLSVYQPIVSMTSGEILGWEALTRGPDNSYFQSPDVIFSFAEDMGLLYPTEKVCREIAINNIGSMEPDQKLFLNVHPRTVADPNFVRGETLKRLQDSGIMPQNIVIEITERHSIDNYKIFRKTLEHYRSQGYRIAIDDVGAGFSGLQSIAEIRPDYIKMDMSLVRNIDSSSVRQVVMEALITLSEKINCRIIAEGIETQNELNALLELGVHYGQGYYLARPANPKPQLPKTLEIHIKRQGCKELSGAYRRSLCIGDIAVPSFAVDENVTVSDVKGKLDASKQPISGLVVLREERPVGLVMRHNLYRVLSTQYGVHLYSKRPVSTVMDSIPLMVDVGMPVEQAAEIAMNRRQENLYDDLLVTENNSLVGIVSVQKLLDSITRIQMELAKGANPLSGLPGNVAIEEELARRCRAGNICTVIYADLDRFKAYNDTYGFERGDQMILLLADILLHTSKKYGVGSGFAGHIGGDDMIVICSSECAEKICIISLQLFERLVKRCFQPADRAKGEFFGQDRNGCQMWVPLVSVSMAVVECTDEKSYRTLAERAAHLKKYAKSLPGNVYVMDRPKEATSDILPVEAPLRVCRMTEDFYKKVGLLVKENEEILIIDTDNKCKDVEKPYIAPYEDDGYPD